MLLSVLLLVGPLLTVALLRAGLAARTLHAAAATVYLGVALLFWSPLPFGVPAVLLDEHRDAVLPDRGRLVRAVALSPVLLTRPGCRGAFAASLVGFAAAALTVSVSLGH